MNDWTKKLFIDRADLFLKLLDQRWPRTEELVNGMVKLMMNNGISSGRLLDLCCGNGRVSIYMAKKGFEAVGVDVSPALLKDASKKARQHGVLDRVTFLQADVRNLREAIGDPSRLFDVVTNVWTSIGFFSYEDDLSVFRQARELSKENAILFVAETMHTEYLSIKFAPSSYTELDGIVMLENRKYDPITSQANTLWIFYNRRGKDLEFIDEVEISHHVYSLSELSSLLRKAGWETITSYGSLSTMQPMSPLTSLNIVAKAR